MSRTRSESNRKICQSLAAGPAVRLPYVPLAAGPAVRLPYVPLAAGRPFGCHAFLWLLGRPFGCHAFLWLLPLPTALFQGSVRSLAGLDLLTHSHGRHVGYELSAVSVPVTSWPRDSWVQVLSDDLVATCAQGRNKPGVRGRGRGLLGRDQAGATRREGPEAAYAGSELCWGISCSCLTHMSPSVRPRNAAYVFACLTALARRPFPWQRAQGDGELFEQHCRGPGSENLDLIALWTLTTGLSCFTCRY
ncbi:unnamed protein product [Gadus morhua 'NCC']